MLWDDVLNWAYFYEGTFKLIEILPYYQCILNCITKPQQTVKPNYLLKSWKMATCSRKRLTVIAELLQPALTTPIGASWASSTRATVAHTARTCLFPSLAGAAVRTLAASAVEGPQVNLVWQEQKGGKDIIFFNICTVTIFYFAQVGH